MAAEESIEICQPSKGFDYCFIATVKIYAPAEALWYYLGDMDKMSEFFPSLEFRRDQSGPLKVGEKYFSKLNIQKNWTAYQVLAAKPNQRLSARQMGRYLFISAMRYDHRLITEEGATLSQERVEYSLSGGIFAPVLNKILAGPMLRKLNMAAHRELKKRVEAGQPPPAGPPSTPPSSPS